ncbi:EamA family transporter [Actinokineospora sp. NBRC 105648]|uniref:EamA family transporter n=1 Tax=Actinokineospora sp. NBRC 105648 TaxID=3032206 RepID=UPI0024A48B7A|nr:EamA family transporter [Actinokineospora sp. NBRC 105648]GLZ41233.1 hypothetical protein Acsp05_48570 [Actinokineospora sp. NBRC 105648]
MAAAVLGGLSVALWAHLLATGVGSVLAVLVDPWRIPTKRESVALLVVAVLTVVAFVIWYLAVNVLGADRAGVLIGVMPVAGLVVSVAMGAQELTVVALAGVAVVGIGCAVGLLRPSPRTPRTSPSHRSCAGSPAGTGAGSG